MSNTTAFDISEWHRVIKEFQSKPVLTANYTTAAMIERLVAEKEGKPFAGSDLDGNPFTQHFISRDDRIPNGLIIETINDRVVGGMFTHQGKWFRLNAKMVVGMCGARLPDISKWTREREEKPEVKE